MSNKILHISGCDKFIPPFIQFVKDNFEFSQHEFLLSGGMAEEELIKAPNVHFAKRSVTGRLKHYLQAVIKMHQADKVILHGLFDINLVFMLFWMPWLLKKCHWVMWGGDLYVYQLGERNWKWKVREFFRRPVIKRIGHLVTYIKGDVDLARKWYGAKGQYHECIMYLSNVYKALDIPVKTTSIINIQVGNSADPSNNHIEVLEKLLPYKDEDICIYVPLSYGNQEHAGKVIAQGRKLFGDKFVPLTEFMPFDEYLSFLGKIDIAIFNHKRQQAMGNTITLLGLGKVVYLCSDTTQWSFFKKYDIQVFNVNSIRLVVDSFDFEINKSKIKSFFSKDNYKKQLVDLFC